MRPIALASVLLLSTTALAHSKLNKPDPINPNDANKMAVAPCGAPVGTPLVATYQVGSQVDISWYETINHVGGFEIRFAQNGEGDCTMTNNGVAPVAGVTAPYNNNTNNAAEKICPTKLLSMVDTDDAGIVQSDPTTWKLRTAKVTMPAAPCTNCIIQLIQWMGSNGNTAPTTYTAYHSCAKINLTVNAPPDMAGTAPPDMAMADAPDLAAPAGGGGGGDTTPPDMAMKPYQSPSALPGCSMAGDAPAPAAWPALLLLVALVVVGRRYSS
jgi:hypothetical protein